MATWKNLDTLASYSKLAELKGHVNIADAMAGEKGAERVKKYSTPMAAGLTYNYAAKQVDETVLDALAKLADEAELIDKFQELYNGAVINTGEKRMVLHHLARTQLGEPVVVDGVDKREFYVAQQKKAAEAINVAQIVKVTAYDGTTYDAAVIGGDEDYDIAVIKVEGTNFQPVVIGKSGSVQIGETVAAVGNPLGELTFSMSQGIVSCVNRAINVDGKPFNMIQVDCSINPGNSGGPLFNSYGEVIGIVSAKYSSYSNTTVEGIGFAIPIDDVLAMVKDIMTDGYVTNKPYIGITPQNMTAQMAQQYRYDVTQGVFVCSVEPGSAAEKAGLQMGDVITKIGDTAISDMNDLNAAKKSYRAGDTVTLTIYRAGGTKEVELTFDAAPQTQETAQDSSQQQQQGGSNGGYYYNPWDFFNSFFGNGYYGSSYSGESRDAA